MQWIFETPIPRLECGVAFALLAHVTLAQEDRATEHEPVALSRVIFPAAAEDAKEKTWNAHGQFTYIWQRKDPNQRNVVRTAFEESRRASHAVLMPQPYFGMLVAGELPRDDD